MLTKQRTIKKAVSYSGIGLHTGKPSTITFHPAPENYGYKFIRTDLDEAVKARAVKGLKATRVVMTILPTISRSTPNGGFRVHRTKIDIYGEKE